MEHFTTVPFLRHGTIPDPMHGKPDKQRRQTLNNPRPQLTMCRVVEYLQSGYELTFTLFR
jgi:hypothetical protein